MKMSNAGAGGGRIGRRNECLFGAVVVMVHEVSSPGWTMDGWMSERVSDTAAVQPVFASLVNLQGICLLSAGVDGWQDKALRSFGGGLAFIRVSISIIIIITRPFVPFLLGQECRDNAAVYNTSAS